MNARPIPFNGEMIRAKRDGRKTQTRRVIDIPEKWEVDTDLNGRNEPALGKITSDHPKKGRFGLFIKHVNGDFTGRDIVPCPYGQPGDLLWVREAWRTEARYDLLPPRDVPTSAIVSYEADYTQAPNDGCRGRYRHARFMSRWASRLTLLIKNVRVERVRDISDEDAKAEGAPRSRFGPDQDGRYYREWRTGFRELWDSINADRGHGWKANPLVWVIEFEVIHANVDAVLQNPSKYANNAKEAG